MRLTRDSDGSSLWVVSPIDARLEASQLKLHTQQYFGDVTGGLITVAPGDVVLDVGANIGSFARLAASLVDPSEHVYAIEHCLRFHGISLPAMWVPAQVFAALLKNIALDSNRGADTQTAPVTPIQACITSDSSAITEDMTYFPRCTAFSTLARHRDDGDALQSSLSLVVHDDKPATSWLQVIARGIGTVVPVMAEKFGFEREFVTYKWPHWLHKQTDKQRIIWSYKFLFLDMLFPSYVERIICVNSDQVIRTDFAELCHLDTKAKTIDLCNNSSIKEAKLHAARRTISEQPEVDHIQVELTHKIDKELGFDSMTSAQEPASNDLVDRDNKTTHKTDRSHTSSNDDADISLAHSQHSASDQTEL